jgi:hypothetical protein
MTTLNKEMGFKQEVQNHTQQLRVGKVCIYIFNVVTTLYSNVCVIQITVT